MFITDLKPNQCFVFSSNSTGFHGAGSAGYACRGDHRNNWRQDRWFKAAMASPPGSQERIGKWAVYGVARGFQEGRDGKSYAIQTIVRPGKLRSTSLREIYYQLVELYEFARVHSNYEFLVTPLGEGYAGYTQEEMAKVWEYLHSKHGQPANIKFLRDERLT